MSDRKANVVALEYLLRSGGSLPEGDSRLYLAKELAKNDILSIEAFSTVKCALEDDSDFNDLTDDQLGCPGEVVMRPGRFDAICPKCGRRIRFSGKKVFTRYETNLNWKGIVNHVRHLISQGHPQFSGKGVQGVIEVKSNSMVVRVCFPESCRSDMYLTWFEHFVNPIVYIISNTGRIHKAEYPADVVVLTLGEILSVKNPSDILSSALNEAVQVSSDTLSRVDFEEFSKKIVRTLSNLSPDDFEEFIGKLLETAKRDPKLLENYRLKLKRRSHSLLGAIIRVIGGTGAEDIMVEPKLEYLRNFFSGSGTYEMKRYSSSLKLDDLRELMDHCEQRGTAGILFTSAGRVASSVWSRIRSTKLAQGNWKYIVVDRDLLSEIMVELRLTGLLAAN